MKEEIRSIQKKMNITVIYVTHDQSEALQMSDKVVIMNKGYVEQIATPTEIYHNPATPFVAGFVGKNNIIEYEGETIAVRPENITVTTAAVQGKDCLRGKVVQSAFQGTHYFCRIETECGVMLTQVSADVILQDGQEVWLSWEKCNRF